MTQANSIRNIIVILIAVIVAIWLGMSLVTDQSQTILKIGAAGLFLTCIFLGRKVWLLFIFFNALAVPLIRGFSTAELGMVLFVGFTFAIILMRRQPLKFKFTEIEFWALMIVGTVVQVYFRNPVGLNMFGASSVGARPYFELSIAFLTFVFLSNIVVTPREIKWSMGLTLLGWLASPVLSKIRGAALGGGSISAGSGMAFADAGQGGVRNHALGSLGLGIAKLLSAYRNPLRMAFHPLWGIIILLSLAFAAASGYRNMIANIGLIYMIAIAYRGGFSSVVIASLIGVFALAILALTNLAFPLPLNIQRALSPFPGTWDERVVEGADASTEWRVDMWKEALFTDFWIRNKILGDGLGLTQRELQLIMDAETGISTESLGSGMTAQQESMMITGGYHSGPVQCVRITGYVGLAILLIAMIRTAVHAHRQILRCRGTEWYPLALFFGIPIIALPIFYTFIFGDFGNDVSATFISMAMIRLLEKNLPLPPYVIRKREPYVLMTHRNQNARPGNA